MTALFTSGYVVVALFAYAIAMSCTWGIDLTPRRSALFWLSVLFWPVALVVIILIYLFLYIKALWTNEW